jgi:hypothetical protein
MIQIGIRDILDFQIRRLSASMTLGCTSFLLLLPKRRLNAKLIGAMNQTAQVVTEELTKHFILTLLLAVFFYRTALVSAR